MKIKLIVFAMLLFSVTSCSKESGKFAGVYKLEGAILLINSDNTCFILSENSCVKGIVEIKDSIITIRPYVPEVPFVLYGRVNNIYREEREGERGITSSKIMFQNFDSANALANLLGDDTTQTMTSVLNSDSNCVDYPLVFDNENQADQFYFAVKGKQEVYEFATNEYTDFIVQYIAPDVEDFELVLHWDKKSNELIFEGKPLEQNKEMEFESTVKKIAEMYGRAFPESDYYYCNPEYNFFEENGIDVHTEQYEKVKNGEEYFYVDKLNGSPITHETDDSGDYTEADANANYQSSYQINEYKKIKPKIIKNQTCKVLKNSLFTFTCDEN